MESKKLGRKTLSYSAFKAQAKKLITSVRAELKTVPFKGKEWQNLRKRLLMQKLRLRQRKQVMRQRTYMDDLDRILPETLLIISQKMSHDKFNTFLDEAKTKLNSERMGKTSL